MAANGFLISQSLHQDIKRTIARVDGVPFGGGITKIPTDLGGSDGFQQKTFRIATFTGAWSVNTDKSVTLVSDTASTVNATNLFYTLPTVSSGTQQCAIAKDGTAWYLVAPTPTVTTAAVSVITNVTLGTAGLQFTRAVLTVVATATASNTNIGTTACS